MTPRKPTSDPTHVGDVKINVTAPELLRVMFERPAPGDAESDPADQQEVQFRLGFGAARIADDAVSIELSAESREGMAVKFEVAFRTTLSILPTQEGSSLDWAATLSEVAVRVGPVVVFPYLRETLSALSTRAGMAPIVLPVMNVGAVFDPPDFGNGDSAEASVSAKKPNRRRKSAG